MWKEFVSNLLKLFQMTLILPTKMLSYTIQRFKLYSKVNFLFFFLNLLLNVDFCSTLSLANDQTSWMLYVTLLCFNKIKIGAIVFIHWFTFWLLRYIYFLYYMKVLQVVYEIQNPNAILVVFFWYTLVLLCHTFMT